MDHRRPICPRPPSPILPGGCNSNGRSLPHAPPSGYSTLTDDTTPPPDTYGRLTPYKEWLQRAIREDQQAAGLLPPQYGGPILHGARARAEHVYKDWKWAIDELWEDKRRRLQLVKDQAARARQEAALQQQLLDEHAACARQEEAARSRQLLNELAAQARQEAARARQEAASRRQKLLNKAARTIFLWLRRCRLHVRLTRKTARRQHREAALARLRYEDACHRRAALAEAKRREDTLAEEQRHLDEAKRQEDALAEEERHRAFVKMHRRLAAIAARQEQVLAVLAAQADEQRRHEAVLAAQADKQRRHEAVLAAQADELRRHKAVLATEESDAVIDRIRTELALCAAPLDAISAEIACEEAASTTKPSPRRPTSYVDAVLSNIRGGTHPSLPLAVSPSALVPAALPSPDVDPPTPHQMLDGLHTPASTMWADANVVTRRPHGLWSSRLLRSAVAKRLRRGPRWPQCALSRTREAAMRLLPTLLR